MCVCCVIICFFFLLLSESEIKCLLRSDRGSQLSKGAESLFPVLIIGLCRSCINSSLKVLNHIFKPRNDCANCGSSNFCIQPSIRQTPDTAGQEAAVVLQRAASGRGSCVGRRELAGCCSPAPYPALGFASWHTAVWGEGALEVRPQAPSPGELPSLSL